MAGPTTLAVLSCCLLSLACLSSVSGATLRKCPPGSVAYNFNGTRITAIGKDFLAGSSPTCLDLQRVQLSHIERGAFEKLPKLTDLYLSHNWIQNIEYLLSFGPVRTLRTLAFDNAQTGSRTHRPVLELGQVYPELRELSVSDNAYVTVTHTGIINKAIMQVDVSRTNLAVQWNVFPKLEHADFSGNMFEDWSFPGVLPPSMLTLDVSRNRLSYFHGEYMPKLRTLLLNSNAFRRIDSKLLQPGSVLLYGLKELRQLSLNSNQLTALNCAAFKDVPLLEVLDLSFNSLKTVQSGCFDSMTKLKSLNLTNVGLTKVLEVNGTMNIEVLDLAFNDIKDVPANAFAKMLKIKKLDLSGNALRSINLNSFAGLAALEELNLDMNMLSALPANWMPPSKKLHTLRMNSNALATLKSLPIGKTSTLRQLYVQNNPIANLTADVFDNLPKALVIYINVQTTGRKFPAQLFLQ